MQNLGKKRNPGPFFFIMINMKYMKNILIFVVFSLLVFGCEKEGFDVYDPDVEKFVQQIKSGTYDCYEKGAKGENLWQIMPKFTKSHIQSLIEYSNDTTHIAEYPFNPISSRSPYPYMRGYCILGECLLWSVEGIRNERGYGSLDPYLIDTTSIERNSGLDGSQVLIARDYYKNWWNAYQNKDWKEKNPLEGTSFRWF